MIEWFYNNIYNCFSENHIIKLSCKLSKEEHIVHYINIKYYYIELYIISNNYIT